MGGYSVPERWVVSEIIDGEAILLDLRSGSYYSACGLGAQVWQAIADGADVAEVARQLALAYPDVGAVDTDLDAFIQDLTRFGLIEAATRASSAVTIASDAAYAAPRIERYEDMKDLFMLDPIHDVDEVGWPVRKEAASMSEPG